MNGLKRVGLVLLVVVMLLVGVVPMLAQDDVLAVTGWWEHQADVPVWVLVVLVGAAVSGYVAAFGAFASMRGMVTYEMYAKALLDVIPKDFLDRWLDEREAVAKKTPAGWDDVAVDIGKAVSGAVLGESPSEMAGKS